MNGSKDEIPGTAVPFNFEFPETVRVARLGMSNVMSAIIDRDLEVLFILREMSEPDAASFDRFVSGVTNLVNGNHLAAVDEFGALDAPGWRLASGALHVAALSASGNVAEAVAVRNRLSDWFLEKACRDGEAINAGDITLLGMTTSLLHRAEAVFANAKPSTKPPRPLAYVVGYPRSGNTQFLQFLRYAFDTPIYTVYASPERYFSRLCGDSHAARTIFVKDHLLQPQYAIEKILAPMRDGRDATVSLARYLFAKGSNRYVRIGELADFISYVNEKMPYSGWGRHTMKLMNAIDRGASIQLVRYEDVTGRFDRLLAIAEQFEDDARHARKDDAGFSAFVAREKRLVANFRGWSERLDLPPDSFIPQHWSIGGGTIDWRRAFDAPARRRFHELGGTEALIRLGYETDEQWWRSSD